VFLDQSSHWGPGSHSAALFSPHTKSHQASARNVERDHTAARCLGFYYPRCFFDQFHSRARVGGIVKAVVGRHCHNDSHYVGCLDHGLLRQRMVSWRESNGAALSLQETHDMGNLPVRLDVSTCYFASLLSCTARGYQCLLVQIVQISRCFSTCLSTSSQLKATRPS
jgi:hypothetical protein